MGSRGKNSFRTHLNFKSYSLNNIQLMRTINLEVKDGVYKKCAKYESPTLQ